jgi:hypothetical protein
VQRRDGGYLFDAVRHRAAGEPAQFIDQQRTIGKYDFRAGEPREEIAIVLAFGLNVLARIGQAAPIKGGFAKAGKAPVAVDAVNVIGFTNSATCRTVCKASKGGAMWRVLATTIFPRDRS